MTVAATAPTFGGHASYIDIGRSRFGLPPGSRTRRRHGDRKHAEAVYVLEQSGSMHLLTEAGEIPIPPRLVEPLTRRYFPEQTNKIL